jgi:TonB-dependent starch-binding outer membrane protein SusC
MKKKPQWDCLPPPIYHQLFRIMKVFLILAIFSIAPVFAVTVNSQSIQLNKKELTVREAFREIERQSEYSFFYNADFSNLNTKVRLHELETDIHGAMGTILESTNLTYRIIDDNLIVITPIQNQDEHVVSGRVTSLNDQSTIPGVTVQVKNTTKGTVTDIDGRYSIGAEPDDILVFSFVGMTTKEMPVRGRSRIDVELETQVNSLDEVVVVGYGTTKQRDLTGAVVRLPAKTFENSSFTSIGQILQGQVAGMEVVSGTGRPGDQVRIRIRGESSLMADASPLIVIDDIPMPDGYDINLINPNDIENIDILKGASAAAIYGSKGSSGVIMITTKQGGQRRVEFFYDGNISTQGYVSKIQPLEAEDFKKLVGRSYIATQDLYNSIWPGRYRDIRTLSAFFGQAVPGSFGEANTDWMNAMTQTPVNTNHTLGIRGGSREASYYASFSYTSDQGRVIGNGFERFTGIMNMDLRPTSWFEIGFRAQGSTSGTIRGQSIQAVVQARPDIPVYDDNGDYYRYWSTGHTRYLDHPLQLSLDAPNITNAKSYTMSTYGRIVFSKSLRYQLTASYAASESDNRRYLPSYTYDGSGGYYGGVTGILNAGNNYSNQLNIDNVLYYTLTTDMHDVSVMLGSTFNQDKDGYVTHQFRNFPDDYIQNVNYNATTWSSTTGTDDASAYFSLYSRLNYKFRDRYLFTGTIRRDASSKFGPENRAGMFPSAAFAWVLTEEDFFDLSSISLTFLKLRVGYGVTGNNRIGRYAWRSSFGSTQYFNLPGTYPVTIGNEQVRWEETAQTDIGLDFGFWGNRILGSFGWYNKNTDGLLLGYSLAPSAGLTRINMNYAEIKNQGLEFDIRGQILESKDWSLMLGFNIAHNEGKVMKLSKEIMADASGADPGTSSTTVIREGYPIGLFYGWRVDRGVYNATGGYTYLDLDESGTIGYEDREVLGSAVPDFFGGFNIDTRYKRFTARMTGKFSYGAMKHWTGLKDHFHANAFNPANVFHYALYAYHPANPDSRFQAFAAGWERPGITDNYLFNADFLKISDVTLGYDLPAKWVESIGFSNINLYGSVNNLITFTNYPGTNVEAFTDNLIQGPGLDLSSYPLIRNFTFGIKAMIR